MKPIKFGYLKGYYGYKNFGDELLGLGVIKYLFANYPLEKLYIEVDNVDWFLTWLQRHKSYLGDTLCKVKLIAKSDKLNVISLSILSPKVHLFLGGGEIFAPARGRFYGGWNMFILYFWKFWAKKVTLLGGIGHATSRTFGLLYRLTLPFAQKIILRDQNSYDYLIKSYNLQKTAILYHDFAYDVLSDDDILCQGVSTLTKEKMMSKTGLHCPYLLVNTNPYVDMSMLTEKLTILTQKYPSHTFVYFPCGVEDKPLFGVLTGGDVDREVDRILTSNRQKQVDNVSPNIDKIDLDRGGESDMDLSTRWTMFEWTEHDIPTIVALSSQATQALGVRLHFIALMARLGVPFDYVVYQEKIEKFLAGSKSYKKLR